MPVFAVAVSHSRRILFHRISYAGIYSRYIPVITPEFFDLRHWTRFTQDSGYALSLNCRCPITSSLKLPWLASTRQNILYKRVVHVNIAHNMRKIHFLYDCGCKLRKLRSTTSRMALSAISQSCRRSSGSAFFSFFELRHISRRIIAD